MKNSLKIFKILLIIALLLAGCEPKNTGISGKIIKAIDEKSGQSNTCQISMQEITDFKWDRMAIFQVGSSNAEISKALGIEYKGPTDLMSGMVFAYDNKIVYEERVPYNPDRAERLEYIVEHKSGESKCAGFSPDDAVVKGSRNKIDGNFYYKVTAVLP